MPKNPVFQQKYKEGFEAGIQEGINRSSLFFKDKFLGLENAPGIGPKTIEKIKEQLGEQYFK